MDCSNWADFTSMKSDDWPPSEFQSEESAWNETVEDLFPSRTAAAVTGGIASAIMAGHMK